jgi:TBC1 domain family member 15
MWAPHLMRMAASQKPSGDPPSPSASYYDVSDAEEGEYNTIAHASSGRGVKLLFSKSKVSELRESNGRP